MQKTLKKSLSNSMLAIILVASYAIPVSAQAQTKNKALKVFACEPEWAALSKQLGGDFVKVNSATTAFQDPHHIQARPSLIAKARKADLLICSGAELEVGWLPVLLKKSGNKKIQPHTTGHIMATDHVELLGKLSKVTRSMGDVHAQGNPHVHLDPKRMLKIAAVVNQRLQQIDPNNAAAYEQNHQAFVTELDATLQQLAPQIDALQGKRWAVHHNNWLYLNDWLGLNQVTTLEPKPGIPPTTRHLATLVDTLKSEPVAAIAYGSYQPRKASQWLGKKTNTRVIAMPYSIDDWQQQGAISAWYKELINTLSDGLNDSNNENKS